MIKQVNIPQFQTTDGTFFTDIGEASKHQATLDQVGSMVIETFTGKQISPPKKK